MARILIAASPEPRAVAERILAGHELACAETMEQGRRLLREGNFDLVFCTITFDESRMFDFVRLAKSRPEWRRIPLVVARVRSHILSPAALRSTAFACAALGAELFLDIAAYRMDPEREMRNAIDGILVQRRVEAPAGPAGTQGLPEPASPTSSANTSSNRQ